MPWMTELVEKDPTAMGLVGSLTSTAVITPGKSEVAQNVLPSWEKLPSCERPAKGRLASSRGLAQSWPTS